MQMTVQPFFTADPDKPCGLTWLSSADTPFLSAASDLTGLTDGTDCNRASIGYLYDSTFCDIRQPFLNNFTLCFYFGYFGKEIGNTVQKQT
jgi:hypothetical protein